MMTVVKTEGKARRGVFETPHGTVQTPAFMNVATCGAIKGGLSAFDLKEIRCQVMLCNTYHLHVRPGDDLVRQMGGLHRFTGWDGPIADGIADVKSTALQADGIYTISGVKQAKMQRGLNIIVRGGKAQKVLVK